MRVSGSYAPEDEPDATPTPISAEGHDLAEAKVLLRAQVPKHHVLSPIVIEED